MINHKSIQTEIAIILSEIGRQKCLAKAEILTRASSLSSSLHLRDLELNASNITSIMRCFKQEETAHIKSISLSYNPLLGDSGAIIFIKNLPKTVREIGLVNCGISDLGGMEILDWMQHSTELKMICMEQNEFSEQLSLKFQKFSVANPHILVVY